MKTLLKELISDIYHGGFYLFWICVFIWLLEQEESWGRPVLGALLVVMLLLDWTRKKDRSGVVKEKIKRGTPLSTFEKAAEKAKDLRERELQ